MQRIEVESEEAERIHSIGSHPKERVQTQLRQQRSTTERSDVALLTTLPISTLAACLLPAFPSLLTSDCLNRPPPLPSLIP